MDVCLDDVTDRLALMPARGGESYEEGKKIESSDRPSAPGIDEHHGFDSGNDLFKLPSPCGRGRGRGNQECLPI